MAKTPLTIVSRIYSTHVTDPAAQFQAWRDYIAPIYDVRPIGLDAAAGFPAEVQAWHLGSLLIGRSSFAAHRFFRDQSRISRDGLAHILVQLCLEGGYAGVADGREMAVGAGDVAVIDLARPLALEAMATRTLDVIIPRTLLDPHLSRQASLSGLVLRPGMPTAALLVDHLLSVRRRIADLKHEAAPALTQMIATAIGACVIPLLPTETKHRSDTVTMDRVKAYLDAHLGSPKLGTADICRDLGISRPTLYRMFAGLGGVAAYIQNQRLTLAYSLLVDPNCPHARARDVATACGFVSPAHFHRSFRETFGITPGDVRAVQPKQRVFPKTYVSIDFADVWITQLAMNAAPEHAVN
jgi:AraC-like DNA-binding protein